jgi:hypothetical protein
VRRARWMILGIRFSWVKPPVTLLRCVGGGFALKGRQISRTCPFRSFTADRWEASALTQPSRVQQLTDSAPFFWRGPAEGSWPHRRCLVPPQVLGATEGGRCLRARFVLSHPFRKKRGKDGAPISVAGKGWATRQLLCYPRSENPDLGHPA